MRLRHTVTVVTVATAVAASLGAAAWHQPRQGRTGVRSPTPSRTWTEATPLSAANPRQRVEVRLYLADRNAADLAAQVRAVSDPRSPDYGRT